ncbi:hypothetical protein ACF06D_13575 [Streptomyces griseoluteus]|uniref:hypothetical protein n=1 Tax=Streptomyces griseoluteus TaxID=29306 RepID=UPI0036F8B1D7
MAGRPPALARGLDPAARLLGSTRSELFFSTLARRVFRYGNFSSRDDLINKLESFVINHNTTATPYKWTYDGSPLKTA